MKNKYYEIAIDTQAVPAICELKQNSIPNVFCNSKRISLHFVGKPAFSYNIGFINVISRLFEAVIIPDKPTKGIFKQKLTVISPVQTFVKEV